MKRFVIGLALLGLAIAGFWRHGAREAPGSPISEDPQSSSSSVGGASSSSFDSADMGSARDGGRGRVALAGGAAKEADDSDAADGGGQQSTLVFVDAAGGPVACEVGIFAGVDSNEPLRTLQTDGNGRVQAEVVPAQVIAGFASGGRVGVRVVDDVSPEITVRVMPPVVVRGEVRDLVSDAPIEGARVTARWLDAPEGALERLGADGLRERSALADARGTFELPRFRPGTYRITVSAEGYSSEHSEGPWFPKADWHLGTVLLEALGGLSIQLLGSDAAVPPRVSSGIDGERVPVGPDGRVVLQVPRFGEPQHFSVWLGDGSMMNVYRTGTLDEVEEVALRVGAARSLRVNIEGDFDGAVAAQGELSVRVRYSPEPLLYAEWNCDLDGRRALSTDRIDGEAASIDLLALVERWPNVLCSTRVPLAVSGATEVTLRIPDEARRLVLLGPEGRRLQEGTFVELRRAHDTTRWLASGHTDAAGAVFWPEVVAERLYCSGALDWGPPAAFFIDLPLPNAAGAAPQQPLALGTLLEHRARVVVDGQPLGGARVRLVGRHTDHPWVTFETDAEGWTPTFLLAAGSEADAWVVDARVVEARAALRLPNTEIHVTAR